MHACNFIKTSHLLTCISVWATSKPPWWGRCACRKAWPRTPTAPAAFCSTTPAPLYVTAQAAARRYFTTMRACLQPTFSRHGLLTTVGFQLGPSQPCYYALEVQSWSGARQGTPVQRVLACRERWLWQAKVSAGSGTTLTLLRRRHKSKNWFGYAILAGGCRSPCFPGGKRAVHGRRVLCASLLWPLGP